MKHYMGPVVFMLLRLDSHRFLEAFSPGPSLYRQANWASVKILLETNHTEHNLWNWQPSHQKPWLWCNLLVSLWLDERFQALFSITEEETSYSYFLGTRHRLLWKHLIKAVPYGSLPQSSWFSRSGGKPMGVQEAADWYFSLSLMFLSLPLTLSLSLK